MSIIVRTFYWQQVLYALSDFLIMIFLMISESFLCIVKKPLDSAAKHLNELKKSGGRIIPKKWTAERNRLTAHKHVLYEKMKSMREEIKAVESIRKNAERLAKADRQQSKSDMKR